MSELAKEILDFSIDIKTKAVVKEAFGSSQEISPIDCDFGSFRLLRVNQDTINLEYLLSTQFGHTFEVSAQFLKDGRIVLPHEFFEEHKYSHGISSFTGSGIFGFSMLNNALIAAFSLKSLMIVMEGMDAKEYINGLEMEYFVVEPGELNIYAHDRYGLDPNRALAIGKLINGQLSMDPINIYASQYQYLVDLKLLSLYKIIR